MKSQFASCNLHGVGPFGPSPTNFNGLGPMNLLSKQRNRPDNYVGPGPKKSRPAVAQIYAHYKSYITSPLLSRKSCFEVILLKSA